MILGVGTDIVSISRIARAAEKPRFLERLLTPAEQSNVRDIHWIAGRWAAKEAAFKCVRDLVRFHDVEVRSEPDGRPVILTPRHAAGATWHVSISHDGDYAVAFVLLES